MSLFVKVETRALTDAKLLAAGPEAVCVWLRGLLYAKEHLTDGHIPLEALPLICIGVSDIEATCQRLVKSGLWEQSPDGYTVGAERWSRHQTTKEEVEATRANARERKRRSRDNQRSRDGHANVTQPEYRVQSQSQSTEYSVTSDVTGGTQKISEPSMAASAVRQTLGISGKFLPGVLTDVMKSEAQAGRKLEAVIETMCSSWLSYERARPKLTYSVGAEKFFGEGMWRLGAEWPWKEGQQPTPKRVYANAKAVNQ